MTCMRPSAQREEPNRRSVSLPGVLSDNRLVGELDTGASAGDSSIGRVSFESERAQLVTGAPSPAGANCSNQASADAGELGLDARCARQPANRFLRTARTRAAPTALG